MQSSTYVYNDTCTYMYTQCNTKAIQNTPTLPYVHTYTHIHIEIVTCKVHLQQRPSTQLLASDGQLLQASPTVYGSWPTKLPLKQQQQQYFIQSRTALM